MAYNLNVDNTEGIRNEIIYQLGRHRIVANPKEGSRDCLILKDGPISIFLDTKTIPGQRANVAMVVGGEALNRIRIEFDVPKGLTLPETGIDPSGFESPEYAPLKKRMLALTPNDLKIIQLVQYLKQCLNCYKSHMASRAAFEEKTKQFKVRMEERTKNRKQTLPKRQEFFDQIKGLITNKKVAIDSELEDDYVNIALKNGLKMRIEVTPEGIIVPEISHSRNFNLNDLSRFIEKISEV